MRTFISLKLSKESIQEIKNIQKQLYDSGLFIGKLTEEENLHLTLKFLGEIDEWGVEEVREKLREIQLKKFKAKLGGIGIFSPSFVRIIWIKLDGEGVNGLQREVDDVLKGLFKGEERFMSHLTIARVKNVKDKKKFFHLLEKINVKKVEFDIESFELVRSELFSRGPSYEVIDNFRLE
ncbi:MAG TPA: RNA 2',3'-cyclic phosphodiesterase [Candidatus Nanoarchaeia archaeon]|nr:RNA 2',3'-cyclic phosphodiesterase [Candidatus Nanoarchaeia archaeon]